MKSMRAANRETQVEAVEPPPACEQLLVLFLPEKLVRIRRSDFAV